jgi:hypothetical protein
MNNYWGPATATISMTRGEYDDVRLRLRTDSGLLIDISWELEKFSRSIMSEVAPCTVRMGGSKELEETLRKGIGNGN